MNKENVIKWLENNPKERREIALYFGWEKYESNKEDSFDTVEISEISLFDVLDSDYYNLPGKCFICPEIGQCMKILSNPIDRAPHEFLYELFIEDSDNNTWHLQDEDDLVWLQETAEIDPDYKKYCLTSWTEMNIANESMFRLGKDGNLYVWFDGDRYFRYIPFSAEQFEVYKFQAVEGYVKE